MINYNVKTTGRTALPRSRRLKMAGASSSATTTVVNNGIEQQKAVLYTEQQLTQVQREQARANIGADDFEVTFAYEDNDEQWDISPACSKVQEAYLAGMKIVAKKITNNIATFLPLVDVQDDSTVAGGTAFTFKFESVENGVPTYAECNEQSAVWGTRGKDIVYIDFHNIVNGQAQTDVTFTAAVAALNAGKTLIAKSTDGGTTYLPLYNVVYSNNAISNIIFQMTDGANIFEAGITSTAATWTYKPSGSVLITPQTLTSTQKMQARKNQGLYGEYSERIEIEYDGTTEGRETMGDLSCYKISSEIPSVEMLEGADLEYKYGGVDVSSVIGEGEIFEAGNVFHDLDYEGLYYCYHTDEIEVTPQGSSEPISVTAYTTFFLLIGDEASQGLNCSKGIYTGANIGIGTENDTYLTFIGYDATVVHQVESQYIPNQVTQQEKNAWNAKYAKPQNGIPATDMTQAVQNALAASLNSKYESYQEFGGRNLSNGLSSFDVAILAANNNMFAGMPNELISVHYSNDAGANWTDYEATGTSKNMLFNRYSFADWAIGKHTASGSASANDMLRVDIDCGIRSTGTVKLDGILKKLLINIGTCASSGCYVIVQGGKLTFDFSDWTYTDIAHHTDGTNKIPIDGWTGWNSITIDNNVRLDGRFNRNYYYERLRLTFGCTSVSGNYSGLKLHNIVGVSNQMWSYPSRIAAKGVPFELDWSNNVKFDGIVNAIWSENPSLILGSASYRFQNAYLKYLNVLHSIQANSITQNGSNVLDESDVTNQVTSGSTQVVTSGAVHTAIGDFMKHGNAHYCYIKTDIPVPTGEFEHLALAFEVSGLFRNDAWQDEFVKIYAESDLRIASKSNVEVKKYYCLGSKSFRHVKVFYDNGYITIYVHNSFTAADINASVWIKDQAYKNRITSFTSSAPTNPDREIVYDNATFIKTNGLQVDENNNESCIIKRTINGSDYQLEVKIESNGAINLIPSGNTTLTIQGNLVVTGTINGNK